MSQRLNVKIKKTIHHALQKENIKTNVLFFLQQVEDLSHNSLIRRAASVLTDSSSSFLSQATLALTDALTDYSKVDSAFALNVQIVGVNSSQEY